MFNLVCVTVTIQAKGQFVKNEKKNGTGLELVSFSFKILNLFELRFSCLCMCIKTKTIKRRKNGVECMTKT